LSALLTQVKAGETIEITDRDRPIARIVPIENLPWSERIDELAHLGLVRLPTGPPLVAKEVIPIQLENGGFAGVLEAVLEERSEGR
jgi:prevent-host-death family protein